MILILQDPEALSTERYAEGETRLVAWSRGALRWEQEVSSAFGMSRLWRRARPYPAELVEPALNLGVVAADLLVVVHLCGL